MLNLNLNEALIHNRTRFGSKFSSINSFLKEFEIFKQVFLHHRTQTVT